MKRTMLLAVGLLLGCTLGMAAPDTNVPEVLKQRLNELAETHIGNVDVANSMKEQISKDDWITLVGLNEIANHRAAIVSDDIELCEAVKVGAYCDDADKELKILEGEVGEFGRRIADLKKEHDSI